LGETVELTGARQVANDYLWVEVIAEGERRGWSIGAALGIR
jgi:hypothetical protein